MTGMTSIFRTMGAVAALVAVAGVALAFDVSDAKVCSVTQDAVNDRVYVKSKFKVALTQDDIDPEEPEVTADCQLDEFDDEFFEDLLNTDEFDLDLSAMVALLQNHPQIDETDQWFCHTSCSPRDQWFANGGATSVGDCIELYVKVCVTYGGTEKCSTSKTKKVCKT